MSDNDKDSHKENDQKDSGARAYTDMSLYSSFDAASSAFDDVRQLHDHIVQFQQRYQSSGSSETIRHVFD